jgi:hypothetical protein
MMAQKKKKRGVFENTPLPFRGIAAVSESAHSARGCRLWPCRTRALQNLPLALFRAAKGFT